MENFYAVLLNKKPFLYRKGKSDSINILPLKKMSFFDLPDEIIIPIAKELDESSLCHLIESCSFFLFLRKEILKKRRRIIYHHRHTSNEELIKKGKENIVDLRRLEGIIFRKVINRPDALFYNNGRSRGPDVLFYDSGQKHACAIGFKNEEYSPPYTKFTNGERPSFIRIFEKQKIFTLCYAYESYMYVFHEQCGQFIEAWCRKDQNFQTEDFLKFLHKLNGPAARKWIEKDNLILSEEEWGKNGKPHRPREEGPSYIYYHTDGTIKREIWKEEGEYIEGRPSDIYYTPEGKVCNRHTYLNGKKYLFESFYQ